MSIASVSREETEEVVDKPEKKTAILIIPGEKDIMMDMKSPRLNCIIFATLTLIMFNNLIFAQHNYPLIYEDHFESGSANWTPNIPGNWQTGSDEQGHFYKLLQAEPIGTPRKPASISILTPFRVGNFELEVVAKSNTDSTIQWRDICLFYGYQDPVHFYYTHFSARSDDNHNITAIVNNADRKKVNVEESGSTNTRLTDYQYHTLKIVRSVVSNSIDAYIDDEKIITAVDSAFLCGHIGIGSFDDAATFKSVKLWAELCVSKNEQILNMPDGFSLKQNYPNPFNSQTTIEYTIPGKSQVNISLHNLFSQEIVTLVHGEKTAGYYKTIWNGKDRHDNNVASGIYIYQIRAGDSILSKKLILMR